MDIIDFHTHIFGEPVVRERERYLEDTGFRLLYRDSRSRLITHHRLLDAMEEEGVGGAVCMGFPWESEKHCRSQNEYFAAVAAEHKKVLYPFGSVSGEGGSVHRAVQEIRDLGLAGIGEIAFYSGDDGDAREGYLREVLGAAGSAGLPVCLHVNEPVGHPYPGKYTTDMAVLYDIISSFPEVTLVLAHWGGGLPFYELMPEVREAFRNVVYDTAATPYLYDPAIYAAVCGIVSSEKILFGSDFPLIPPSRYIPSIETQVPEFSDRENILFRNAVRILGQ